MTLDKPKKIDDLLIKYLGSGPVSCLELVSQINHERPNTTKQAVYSALRLLKEREQIIIIKGQASLNITWLNQISSFFEIARLNYTQGAGSIDILKLKEGEKIKYYFEDAVKADIFWTHTYYLLLEQLKPNERVYLYNPHEWFLLARKENEQKVISSTIDKGHDFLLTSGGNTRLDQFIRQYFDGKNSQYNALEKPLFSQNNYYINIFGDFILEAWLDKELSSKIEELYRTHTIWNDLVANEFNKALAMQGRMRIAISKNSVKAHKLRRKLAKDFAIPKIH